MSVETSRQEHWSGVSLPPPGHLPHLGIEPMLLAFPALAAEFLTIVPLGKPEIEDS